MIYEDLVYLLIPLASVQPGLFLYKVAILILSYLWLTILLLIVERPCYRRISVFWGARERTESQDMSIEMDKAQCLVVIDINYNYLYLFGDA